MFMFNEFANMCSLAFPCTPLRSLTLLLSLLLTLWHWMFTIFFIRYERMLQRSKSRLKTQTLTLHFSKEEQDRAHLLYDVTMEIFNRLYYKMYASDLAMLRSMFVHSFDGRPFSFMEVKFFESMDRFVITELMFKMFRIHNVNESEIKHLLAKHNASRLIGLYQSLVCKVFAWRHQIDIMTLISLILIELFHDYYYSWRHYFFNWWRHYFSNSFSLHDVIKFDIRTLRWRCLFCLNLFIIIIIIHDVITFLNWWCRSFLKILLHDVISKMRFHALWSIMTSLFIETE